MQCNGLESTKMEGRTEKQNYSNGSQQDGQPVGDRVSFDKDDHNSNGCNYCCGGDERPSNETLLSTAFISFLGFTLVQTVVAFIAKSEAMLGDSAAMGVDALTYGFNFVAERQKANHHTPPPDTSRCASEEEMERVKRQHKRGIRKRKLFLELIPPIISVTTLLVATFFILHKAVLTLILDEHRDKSEQANPNLELMFMFSTFNLFLDLFNVFCFAKAKHAMGFETNQHEDGLGHTRTEGPGLKYAAVGGHDSHEEMWEDRHDINNAETISSSPPPSSSSSQHVEMMKLPDRNESVEELENGNYEAAAEDDGFENDATNATHQQSKSMSDSSCEKEDTEGDEANLNMCSAYTHVFADTLRSIAVVIASVVASTVDSVTSEVADATAAVVVSAIIVLSVLPLFQGLLQTGSELSSIYSEEASDRMLLEVHKRQLQQNEQIARATMA